MGRTMKLSRHQLMLLVDDDYRENQLKSPSGREAAGAILDLPSAQDILDDLNKQEVNQKWKK